jgi:hypothetical protein
MKPLEEKGQHVTDAFATTYDYLVLQQFFCPSQLMRHHVNINQVTYN